MTFTSVESVASSITIQMVTAKPPKKGKGKCFLPRSSRRILRLCVFGLVLPILLISVPLYVRLVLYPPSHFTMAPTDQRLLSHTSSGVWCQSQRVRMNGSFNAFLLSENPKKKKRFSTHSMLQHMTLKDDVKEYWGFFLQKGSIVTINMCIRYDGGILMIMRGAHNLKTCAWIKEEDSAEQDEDHIDASNESGPEITSDDDFSQEMEEILMNDDDENASRIPDLQEKSNNKTEYNSKERKRELEYYIEKVLTLGKSQKEIYERFQNTTKRVKRRKQRELQKPHIIKNSSYNHFNNSETKEENTHAKQKDKTNFESKKTNIRPLDNDGKSPKQKTSKNYRLERVKRQLENSSETEGEIDHDPLLQESIYVKSQNSSYEVSNATMDSYLNILKLPKELTFIKGSINRSYSHDTSNEEHESSFSSSEESLTKCEGLIGILPLQSSRKCKGFMDSDANKIRYKVPVTGTYYFVFSSDNEVFNSDVYFNMTLKRVVYDTEKAIHSCLNKSDCSLALPFWSHDEAVVEVPEGDWNTAYVMEVKCQPRVVVYLAFLFLIPVFLLFCLL